MAWTTGGFLVRLSKRQLIDSEPPYSPSHKLSWRGWEHQCVFVCVFSITLHSYCSYFPSWINALSIAEAWSQSVANKTHTHTHTNRVRNPLTKSLYKCQLSSHIFNHNPDLLMVPWSCFWSFVQQVCSGVVPPDRGRFWSSFSVCFVHITSGRCLCSLLLAWDENQRFRWWFSGGCVRCSRFIIRGREILWSVRLGQEENGWRKTELLLLVWSVCVDLRCKLCNDSGCCSKNWCLESSLIYFKLRFGVKIS